METQKITVNFTRQGKYRALMLQEDMQARDAHEVMSEALRLLAWQHQMRDKLYVEQDPGVRRLIVPTFDPYEYVFSAGSYIFVVPAEYVQGVKGCMTKHSWDFKIDQAIMLLDAVVTKELRLYDENEHLYVLVRASTRRGLTRRQLVRPLPQTPSKWTLSTVDDIAFWNLKL